MGDVQKNVSFVFGIEKMPAVFPVQKWWQQKQTKCPPV